MALSAVSTFGSLSDLDGFCQIVSIVKAQASVQAASAKMQNGEPMARHFCFVPTRFRFAKAEGDPHGMRDAVQFP